MQTISNSRQAITHGVLAGKHQLRKEDGSKGLDLPNPIRPAGQRRQPVQDSCQPVEKPWNRQLLHINILHRSRNSWSGRLSSSQ